MATLMELMGKFTTGKDCLADRFEALVEQAREAGEQTQDGKLAELKVTLSRLREAFNDADAVLASAEKKVALLALTETGQVLDLSKSNPM